MYLLDTNVISEMRKTKPHGAVAAWFHSIDKSLILLPAVVIGEIQAGIELTRLQDDAKAREIEEWLERITVFFEILPMDGVIFRQWAKLMVGKPGNLIRGAMIAATARQYRLTVVTRNVKDFAHFYVPTLNPFVNS